ncbi:hypothetical protein [Burkholderia sp. 9120]|uniref:hypothetical protein n=1 Tax=Burkholderia sp. 9120 TaxID=1500897 RepID=UPI00054DE401|nr:hypothetical protein [Burkholderia sp. 9120]
MPKPDTFNPSHVARVLMIAAVAFMLSLTGALLGAGNGTKMGYKPETMAYWLQAFGTIGAIVWAAWNTQLGAKIDRRRREEQTRTEIGNLAYDMLHFIGRNVETMRRRPSDAYVSINGAEFSELLQRLTTVRQLPLTAPEMDDVIALRSNLVDSIALIDRYREQGELSDGDYSLLEGYQNELRQMLDRRNSDRRMHRS